MKFETFLNLITDISIQKYPEIHESEATIQLLQEHLLPLYENIYNETEVGFDDMLFKQEIEPKVLEILQHVAKTLKIIFNVYFHHELQSSQSLNKIKHRS